MKLFRKLAINVNSQVENLADRFENKEALSTAYIREYERVVAKAKVKLTEVNNEVNKLEKEANKQKEQIAIWTERARRIHATDESKALECVARIKYIQTGLQQTHCNLEETNALKKQMFQDVEKALGKLDILKRKHQNLTGRQICAEASQTLHHADDSLQDDINNLLSRWETEVVAQELHGHSPAIMTDSLADEFETAEHEQELRLALQQIVTTQESGGEE